MVAIKKTVSIDETLVKESLTIGTNFSAVVESALVEYIQHYRVKKALESYGKWGPRDDKSTEIVKALRHKDERL